METARIRQKINQYLDQLSPEKLLIVADFLGYLTSKERDEATEELIQIGGFQESYQKAKNSISQGKVVNVKQLKRKY